MMDKGILSMVIPHFLLVNNKCLTLLRLKYSYFGNRGRCTGIFFDNPPANEFGW